MPPSVHDPSPIIRGDQGRICLTTDSFPQIPIGSGSRERHSQISTLSSGTESDSTEVQEIRSDVFVSSIARKRKRHAACYLPLNASRADARDLYSDGDADELALLRSDGRSPIASFPDLSHSLSSPAGVKLKNVDREPGSSPLHDASEICCSTSETPSRSTSEESNHDCDADHYHRPEKTRQPLVNGSAQARQTGALPFLVDWTPCNYNSTRGCASAPISLAASDELVAISRLPSSKSNASRDPCLDQNDYLAPEFEAWSPLDETQEIASLRRTHATAKTFKTSLPIDIIRASQKGTGEPLPLPPSGRSRKSRPWLSRQQRMSLRSSTSPNMTYASSELLHVDFTYLEVLQLINVLKENTEAVIDMRTLEEASRKLPGRLYSDILAFICDYQLNVAEVLDKFNIEKCLSNLVIHSGRASLPVLSQRASDGGNMVRRIARRELRSSGVTAGSSELPQLLKAYRVFKGTSGDVNAIEFSPCGKKFLIGCVATADEYNRAGNLALINTGIDRDETRCRILDAKNLSSDRYPSIASVTWTREGQYCMVGGADETLKVYSASGRFLHDKSRKSRRCTHDIATSIKHPAIAITCHSSGHLDLHKIHDDGTSDSFGLSWHEQIAPAVSIFNDSRDQLIVGYQSDKTRSIASQASIFDLTTMKEVETISGRESYAHLHLSGSGLWMAGTNSQGSGIVKIFDPRESQSMVQSFRNNQGDINEINSCENYVTSAATDGTCHVWDVRMVDTEPLHILRHGPTKSVMGSDDVCGITGSFFFHHSSFITGGPDGVVKLWNLGHAQPWTSDLMELVSPITRLCVSPARDQLVVGENRGDAHLYSIRGNGVAEQLIEDPYEA